MILGSLLSSQPLPGKHQRVNNSFPDLFALSLWGEVARVGLELEFPTWFWIKYPVKLLVLNLLCTEIFPSLARYAAFMCRKRNTLADMDKACEWVPMPGNPLVTLLRHKHKVKHKPPPKTGTHGQGCSWGVPPISATPASAKSPA